VRVRLPPRALFRYLRVQPRISLPLCLFAFSTHPYPLERFRSDTYALKSVASEIEKFSTLRSAAISGDFREVWSVSSDE
jgi:hypothetical protein